MSSENLAKFLVYVKAILGISGTDEDYKLKSYIQTAYNFVGKKTNVFFLKEETADIENIFDGAGNRKIYLSKKPITARNKLEYNANTQNDPSWETIDADTYTRNDRLGLLVYPSCFPRGYQNIKATYTLGYDFDSIPAEYEDLKFAVAKICGIAQDLVSLGSVNSETVSGTTIQYSKEFEDSGVSSILDSYSNFGM